MKINKIELKKFEAYIHQVVPLSRQMKIKLRKLDRGGLFFDLPLGPNRNHLGTAFGGSLIAAQALCCWSWLEIQLKAQKLKGHIVIQNCKHDFLRPVTGTFIVHCQGLSPAQFKKTLQELKKNGKTRVNLKAQVRLKNKKCCSFSGKYVIFSDAKN